MKQHDNFSLLICLSLGYAATVELVKKRSNPERKFYDAQETFLTRWLDQLGKA